jgi:hypothetical protein
MGRKYHVHSSDSEGGRGYIILLIVGLLCLLLILAKDTIQINKDFIDTLSKIITAGILIIGGVFSYLKFFKGRTLSPKLVISPKSGIVRDRKGYLHWIEVQIENKGSVAIWSYETSIYAIFDGNIHSRVPISNFVPLPTKAKVKDERLVDVGESVFEHAFLVVPRNVYSITFQIEVKDKKNNVWVRSLTVENPATESNNDNAAPQSQPNKSLKPTAR